MGLKCGIVGLPNVGKSTLFNALTQTSAAEAANYPFCTVDPNVGCVGVPDERLDVLAKLAHSKKVIPTQVEFVDIAGLVRGASQGEGLGNQFLGHIRTTDAILHVLRCFQDDDITHVDGTVDPIRDLETIETELMIADMESLERRTERLGKKVQSLPKEAQESYALAQEALKRLQAGESLRPPLGQKSPYESLELLSDKPVLLVCNVGEDEVVSGNAETQKVAAYAKEHHLEMAMISAAIEAEMAALSPEDQQEFLQTLGIPEKGLSQVIRKAYSLLNLATFFTAGPEETRAWSFSKGSLAPDAAAEIHTDFKRGFICAATISYDDYVQFGGEAGAKAAGKLRLEGKEYVVQDGDVMHFRFNV